MEVLIDPVRLRQIVASVNLVNNAIKFTEHGEVVLEVGVIGMVDADTPERVQLIIRVTDTGIGIAPDKHALIFEAFTQADGLDEPAVPAVLGLVSRFPRRSRG